MSQIDVIKENVQYEQLLRESTTNNVLKGEYLIKDSHPDVNEILGVEAKVVISNKEILADKVMVEGQVNYVVLYASVDESEVARVNSVELSEKFADYLELKGEEHKILCDVECVIEHIQANIMNERKISIDGVRLTKWLVYKIGEFEFVKDIVGNEDVQIQKKNEEINQLKGKVDMELMGNSMIKVTMDKPEIDQILKVSLNLHKKEVRIGDSKVYFGCYCKIEALYKGKDCDDILVLQDDVYLSKEEELVGVNSDMIASYQVDIVNYDCLICPDDLGESRVLNVEFVAKGVIRVLSCEKVEVVKDAYSPKYEMNLVKNNTEISLIHGITPSEVIIKDNLYLKNEDDKLGTIILAYGSPMVTDKTIEDDRVKIEGLLKVSVLYKTTDENSKFDMCSGEIPFSTTVELKGINKDMNLVCNVQLENLDATSEANTIGVRATLSVLAKVSYDVNKDWIIDVVANDEEKKSKKCSVTIYCINKGDTLWNLAKKYNTTIDEIMNINEIENQDELIAGKKIIIPGRCSF